MKKIKINDMTVSLYLQCFGVAVIGWITAVAIDQADAMKLAKKANVVYSWREYFTTDYLAWVSTIGTILLAIFTADEWSGLKPWFIDYIKSIFAFIGFTGSALASFVFGAAKKKLYAAIDYKTSIADKATGTTDKPTPK